MLTGAKLAAGLFEVHVVGSADVHDGDGLVCRQFVERTVGAFESYRGANFFAALARTAQHAAYRDAHSSQSFEMRLADKSQADNGRRLIHSSNSSHRLILFACVPISRGKVPVFGKTTIRFF